MLESINNLGESNLATPMAEKVDKTLFALFALVRDGVDTPKDPYDDPDTIPLGT